MASADRKFPDKRISKVVPATWFIRRINPKSKIANPQAPGFIRGVNLKSKISNLKSIDLPPNRLTHAGSTRPRDRVSGSSRSQRLQIIPKLSK